MGGVGLRTSRSRVRAPGGIGSILKQKDSSRCPGLRSFAVWGSAHDDPPVHERVDRAVVGVHAVALQPHGHGVAGADATGVETAAPGCRVGHRVGVCEDDLRPPPDPQRAGVEGEFADVDPDLPGSLVTAVLAGTGGRCESCHRQGRDQGSRHDRGKRCARAAPIGEPPPLHCPGLREPHRQGSTAPEFVCRPRANRVVLWVFESARVASVARGDGGTPHSCRRNRCPGRGACRRATGPGDLPPDLDPRGLPGNRRESRFRLRRAADVRLDAELRRRPCADRLRLRRHRDRNLHLPLRRRQRRKPADDLDRRQRRAGCTFGVPPDLIEIGHRHTPRRAARPAGPARSTASPGAASRPDAPAVGFARGPAAASPTGWPCAARSNPAARRCFRKATTATTAPRTSPTPPLIPQQLQPDNRGRLHRAGATIDISPPTRRIDQRLLHLPLDAQPAQLRMQARHGRLRTCSAKRQRIPGPAGRGHHTFQVRGKDVGRNARRRGPYSWRDRHHAPTATIDSHPADPSPGGSAAFTYHSSEAGSSFECSLAAEGSPRQLLRLPLVRQTYTELADGNYAFKVRATDPAGNQARRPSFEWKSTTRSPTRRRRRRRSSRQAARPERQLDRLLHLRIERARLELRMRVSTVRRLRRLPRQPASPTAGLSDGWHSFASARSTPAATPTRPRPATASTWRRPRRRSPSPCRSRRPRRKARANCLAAGPPTPPSSSAAALPRRPPPSCHALPARQAPARPSPGNAMRSRVPGTCLALALAAVALALSPVSARATFHLIKIREVYPGSSASPEAEYVELQMYASGQNLVAGHSLDFLTRPARKWSPPPSAQMCRTAPTRHARRRDSGGRIAVRDRGRYRPARRPSSPAGERSAGKPRLRFLGELSRRRPRALRLPGRSPRDSRRDGPAPDDRPNCPTLLEAGDDTDDSAADFANVFPAPRPNAVAPSEHACAITGPAGGAYPNARRLAGAGQGGHARRRRPQTRLRHIPRRVTRDRTPTFRFSSNLPPRALPVQARPPAVQPLPLALHCATPAVPAATSSASRPASRVERPTAPPPSGGSEWWPRR